MIESITLDDKLNYLFIDLENVGYIDLSKIILDKYNIIAVSSRDKKGIKDYKRKYPSINCVYISKHHKQIVDNYICRNSVYFKLIKPNSIITVISSDTGYSIFSSLYGDIDYIVKDIKKLELPMNSTIINIEGSDTDNSYYWFTFIKENISSSNLEEDRKNKMFMLLDLNIEALNKGNVDITVKSFTKVKQTLDTIKVSKLKGLLYDYFSNYKNKVETLFMYLDKEDIESICIRY